MQGLSLRTSVLLVALLGAAACTKSEGPSGTSGTSTSATTATTTAPAASAAPDASPSAADTTTGNAPTGGADAETPTMASAAPSATTSAAPKASGAAVNSELAAANAACGTKPQPDCPLQSWMKKNTNPAIASADLPALATALDQVVAFAPPGYANWASISKDGAEAAKAGDMTAAKASCRTCHDQYKAKYKAELRGRKI